MPAFAKVLKAQRVPHRERPQPYERRKLGILEKKKDYKLRANREREKAKTLKNLYKQAQTRNPDEFCYNMITKAREKNKDSDEEDEPSMTFAQEKLLLTQDGNYVNWKLQIEKKKVEKLQERLRLSTAAKNLNNRHIYFTEHTKDKPNNSGSSTVAGKMRQKTNPEIKILRKELKKRLHRLKELRVVSEKMALRKDLAHKKHESKELISDETENQAAVYKWKPMRKK